MEYTKQEWVKSCHETEADFPLPEGFKNADMYLLHLTYQGAEKRYGNNFDETVRERIDFELETIKTMNCAEYFLVIQDIVAEVRNMGIFVGPGHSTLPGSVVAYCLHITAIDPIKYDLLFERFLNPNLISMPSFNFDLDKAGCKKVLQWVIAKYSHKRVSYTVNSDTYIICHLMIGNTGFIKFCFIGLTILSIIMDTLANIRQKRGIDLNIDTIPLDDVPTYDLFCRGETAGVFMFEADRLQDWLRQLCPIKFEDLIAMNALYRPNTVNFIPEFIARKHGCMPIVYDISIMEKRLKDTYRMPIYQEQIMHLSRDLAGFTPAESDEFRKAIFGKKHIKTLNFMKRKFIAGCKANGYDKKIVNNIWNEWTNISTYPFLKSHAVCYALLAYQTAYLKANFLLEYTAATLRNDTNGYIIDKLFDECIRMDIELESLFDFN